MEPFATATPTRSLVAGSGLEEEKTLPEEEKKRKIHIARDPN
jgi:hypothetical protein